MDIFTCICASPVSRVVEHPYFITHKYHVANVYSGGLSLRLRAECVTRERYGCQLPHYAYVAKLEAQIVTTGITQTTTPNKYESKSLNHGVSC